MQTNYNRLILAAANVLEGLTRTDASNELREAILASRIELMAEDGKVALIESGRDCDGVEYWGKVHTIDANPEAFYALHHGLSDCADGPFQLIVQRVSVAKGIEYGSSDLMKEDQEGVHPHLNRIRYPS